MQRVYFVLDRETQHPLFDRASKESQQFHGDILQVSEDYIPVHEEEKFEQELMHSDQNTYCCYLLMKIYHFMETIQGFRILRMGADFVKDRNGAIWLVNICRLQFQSLPNKGKNAIQTRGMSLLGLDVVQRIPEELPDITEDSERKEEVDFLVNMMKSKYEEAKITYGLAKPPRIDCEDDISNNIFSILYPEIPVKLSTILEISTKHEDLFPIVEKFVRKANHFRNPGKTPQDVNITIEEDRNKQKTFRGNKNINKSKSKENLSPFPGKRIRRRVNFFAPKGGPEQTLPSLEPFETSKEENKSPLLSQPTSPDIKTRSKSQPVLRKIVRNENWSQL